MKKKVSLKTLIALVLIASALTCVLTCVVIMRYLGINVSLIDDVRTYAEIRTGIDRYYIGEYDEEALKNAALSAAVSALDDRWSYYMTAETYASYLNASNNQYAGIGVTVQKDEVSGGLEIMTVVQDGPAHKAGLLIGDIIIEVDGTDITELTTTEGSSLIKKPEGESVSLVVLKPDGKTETVTFEVQVIFSDPVTYEMQDGDVGLIKLKNFEFGSADSFISAVDRLIADGAKSLILDVRNNPGGKVTELTKMLDYLLPEGDIFVSVNKDGQERVTQSDEICVELPMAVLMNGNSYSAAEFFAAALGEYGWAETVGQNTTGKGRSQITVQLKDGGALHISSAEYVTPNRVSLYDEGGLTPDHLIEVDDETAARIYFGMTDKTEDLQLQKAIEILK